MGVVKEVGAVSEVTLLVEAIWADKNISVQDWNKVRQGLSSGAYADLLGGYLARQTARRVEFFRYKAELQKRGDRSRAQKQIPIR